jgi:hypothetical protein
MPNAMVESADAFSINSNPGESYFFKKDGYNVENLQLSLAGASGSVNVGDIVFTVNYMGSCTSEGFSFKADSVFVFSETGSTLESLSPIVIAGKTFQVPVSAQDLELTVSELPGRNIMQIKFSQSDSEARNVNLPKGISFLTLRNAKTGKILGREKAFGLGEN